MTTEPGDIPVNAVTIRRAPGGRWLVVPKEVPAAAVRAAPESLALAGFLDGILDRRRRQKNELYARTIADPSYKGPRIVAEGDSWFEYPFTEDLIMALGKSFAVHSLAKAGDDWQDVLLQNELQRTIDRERPHIVMMSMGGNEIMGGIERFVRRFKVDRPRDDYIIQEDLDEALAFNELQLRAHADGVMRAGAQLILHGYDYVDPRDPVEDEGGQWIGPPLKNLRLIDDRTLWREIANTMLDRLNVHMKKIASDPVFGGRVHYVDLRKTVGSNNINTGPNRDLWNDEIHPTTDGFAKLARKLADKINAIHPLVA